MERENIGGAVSTMAGLQIGTDHPRPTVRDNQGLSSTTALSMTVKEGRQVVKECDLQSDLGIR